MYEYSPWFKRKNWTSKEMRRIMIKIIENGSVATTPGFKASGVQAGLYKHKLDLGLILSDTICTAATVCTTNAVTADTIPASRTNLANGKAQGIIVNSGNANACAPKGAEHVQTVLATLAKETGIDKSDFVINSTGVVGVELPVDKITNAMPNLVAGLAIGDKANADIAMAIMTTDTFPKSIAVQTEIDGKTITIGATAKGSGMIHPNMATMLSFVTTDIAISSDMLQKALSRSTDISYNRVTVDGDTSTNDMVAILANGTAGNKEITSDCDNYKAFLEALNTVNLYLAKQIAIDGEGATHFVTVNIAGAKTEKEATILAKSVMGSSLVKTAIFGSDANWGRILVAMGYSGVSFDKNTVAISFSSCAGDINVCKNGMGVVFDEDLAKKILIEKNININIEMGQGQAESYAFGCDLTYDYVKINGDYRS